MGAKSIINWIKDPNSAFLFGAGCSKCAGKPLMHELTSAVLRKIKCTELDQLVKGLQSPLGKPPTIEDVLNYLLGIQRLLLRRKEKKFDNWNDDTLRDIVAHILQGIADAVGPEWQPSENHKQFFRRIAAILGRSGRQYCDVFSLNYDVVIEATLESVTLPYTEGFRGADAAYFDPSTYEIHVDGQVLFRLYKLHGSISWYRDSDGVARRVPPSSITENSRLMVYPCEQKFYDTRFGVYEVLLTHFRKRLREPRKNNQLVVMGYSFADDHVTDSIIDAINAPGSNLTVMALVGPEENPDDQERRFIEIANRCNSRFNAIVGQQAFVGPALDHNEWEEIKSLDLWRFENLVRELGAE